MSTSEQDRVRQVARNLVEVLASYEEDLMALERACPSVAQLRRAVGTAIAEACYVISDEPTDEWASQGDGATRRTP